MRQRVQFRRTCGHESIDAPAGTAFIRGCRAAAQLTAPKRDDTIRLALADGEGQGECERETEGPDFDRDDERLDDATELLPAVNAQDARPSSCG